MSVPEAEHILCVDDDPQIRRLIQRFVQAAGHECTSAADAAEARSLLSTNTFSIVLCDIELPGQSGLELLEELARLSPDVATLMVTGHDDIETADAALALGAYGYLTKPFGQNELRIDIANALYRRSLELERRSYREELETTVARRTSELAETIRRLSASETQLRRSYRETIDRLGRAIEYHDGVTGAHVQRVATYAEATALELGLDSGACRAACGSPARSTTSASSPSASASWPSRRRSHPRSAPRSRLHTEAGRDLLQGSGNELLELAATIAWTHHERWDGTGYPRRLEGEEIPLEGRIVAVVDVFDALTSDRPYRSALSVEEARAHIADGAGAAFDATVVDSFLRCAA